MKGARRLKAISFSLFCLRAGFVTKGFKTCACLCKCTCTCSPVSIKCHPGSRLSSSSASGVLECRKHLAGRFNIQLAGSRSSYITAGTSAPLYPTHPHPPTSSLHLPAIILIPWLVSHPFQPLPLESSSPCLQHCPRPLFEGLGCGGCLLGGGGLTAL